MKLLRLTQPVNAGRLFSALQAAEQMPTWALVAHLIVLGHDPADAEEAARLVLGRHPMDTPSLWSLVALMREAVTEAHAIVDSREA